MVVKITSPHRLQRALNYNEKKVQKGKAECIHAANYLLNPEQMNFHQKMERMTEQIALNQRTQKTNTLHVSLNFDPSENPGKEKLVAIAQTYMEKIGFGDQPYLVYRHDDAGHPHLHIVTITIREDGKRIDTYNIGRNQSEKARQEIENEFNLVRAGQKQRQTRSVVTPVNVQKAIYGKAETKQFIQNVLDAVIDRYKYTSLAELNAILKQYNVLADRGTPESRTFQKGGLTYCLLDEKGKKIGIPIKASAFYSKPTLANLEKKFESNAIARQPDRQKLKGTLAWTLAQTPVSLEAFMDALRNEKVQTVLRENKQGRIYGITFIDYRSRAVFNGSDLGKQFSIAAIQSRIGQTRESSPTLKCQKQASQEQKSSGRYLEKSTPQLTDDHTQKAQLLDQLLHANKGFQYVPPELLKKKRKKRKLKL